MKVLIVSFDKVLTENLEKALSEHEVYVAKNSEEAIKMIPSDVEGVIYDAISGAISEEDINTLYTKKFSNAKYVILFDELFPIDENNILAPKKILVPRDAKPEDVLQKLVEFPQEDAVEEVKEEAHEEIREEVREEIPQEFEIEPTTLETPEEIVQEVQEEIREEESITDIKEVPAGSEGSKILIVSFDQTLIDSLKANLGSKYEITNVKTVKQAMEQGRDATLIVFDAISGVIAEKGLMEMAGDEILSKKPFVILVDDLFPINVDNIPLEKKVAVSRDTDPLRLKEIVEESMEGVQPPVEEIEVPEEVQEEAHEEIREEVQEEIPQEFEIEPTTLETPEEIVQEVQEEPQKEEEEIPALEALERIIEEQEEEGEEEEEEKEEVAQEPPVQLEVPQVDVEKLIEDAVLKSLSEERIKEAVSKALMERMGDIKEVVSQIVKEEVHRAFEELDIKDLIRQVAYQALKERLEELVS